MNGGMIMKKFLILFITLLIASAQTLAADVSRLYRVKNSTPAQVEKIIQPYIKKKFPDAIKTENSYIIENKNKGIYFVVILANKEDDSYFYYMSNSEDESLGKSLISTLKNNDFKTKKVRDASLKSFFYGEAYTNLAHSNVNTYLRTGNSKQEKQDIGIRAESIEYDFSDEAQARFSGQQYTTPENFVKIKTEQPPYSQESPITLPPQNISQNQNGIRLPKIESSNSIYQDNYNDFGSYKNQNQPPSYYPQNNTLTGSVIHISEGTTFTAALLSDISSDSLANNDSITAELDSDWVFNGQLIAPEGSVIVGRAIDTEAASFAMKNGQIGLLFDEIMTPDGNVIPLKTNKVYIVGNSSRALNVAKRVAGGAATGLLLSAVYLLMGGDPTRAIVTGVSIGAGAGAISAISSKGEEIRVIEGSQVEIMLTEPLTVQLYRQ